MPKLLIVDDNDTLRRSLCLEYREREYMVITAKDGEEARQLLFEKDYLPDYAIIDNNMPKLTGMQLIDLMNNKGLTSKIKTVLVSSNPIDNGIDLSSYAVELIVSKKVINNSLVNKVIQDLRLYAKPGNESNLL